MDDTLTTPANTAGVKDVLANDTDADGDTLTVTLTPTASHGTVSCTAAGACTYTPTAGYSGPDSFTYSISDGHGGTDTATVAVTVTPATGNTLPDAVNDTLTTPEDTAGVKNVLANDTDIDGNALTVTTLTPTASHGTVSCTAAGACTYTPTANYHGAGSFTYSISDGNGGTDTATVSITVTPVNDPPDADVGIVKTALVSPARVGNAAGYRLTVHNPSTVAATSVVIDDSLPSGFRVRRRSRTPRAS